MITRIQYIALAVSALFLMAIGLILEDVGGFGIRSNDVSSPITLSFSEPALLGVPFRVRWQGYEQANIGVVLQMVTEEKTFVLGTGQLLAGAMSVVVPCNLPPAPFRLELIGAVNGGILATSSIDTLPPGPDCVTSS